MRKLNQIQLQQREAIATTLRQTFNELQEQVDVLNVILGKITETQERFNNAVELANSFTQQIAQLQQEYYDERSEQWQESEGGENYQEWIDEWESFSLDEIELDLSDSLVELSEGEEYADQLEELPAKL
ncbi:MAG: hypothetical protein M3R24_34865 [Chloroflexota bacterium]|nr:hypothetical protein [Chloroflexota bacterium]